MGVVTPKALLFDRTQPGELRVWATAYGSDRVAEIRVLPESLTLIRTRHAPPGTTDIVVSEDDRQLVLANPLLDAVYTVPLQDGAAWTNAIDFPAPAIGTAEIRFGELVAFTTIMAPVNSSEGLLSRFTCEACHFEGGIDGRTHFTGRGHVFATTKPLRGLADNVPLFTRGGDRTLASMVSAEFRAANQGNVERFPVRLSDHEWLREIDRLPGVGGGEVISPEWQRRALIAFFVDFRHRSNGRRARGLQLDRAARRGLAVFRDRCADCHQPLASTRGGPGGAVPFEDWEDSLTHDGADLIWGAPFFSKTGIEPYVSRAGARAPSLRRVSEKYPYFTDGSAATLRQVLEGFRYDGPTAWHRAPESHAAASSAATSRSLTNDEIEFLLALLLFF